MLPDEMPPEMNGQPEGSEFAEVEALVDDLATAIQAGAKKAATTDIAEEFQRYGQGILSLAQAVMEFLPVKPDPNVQLKVEGDIVKKAGELAHDAEEKDADRSQAQNSPGGKDGQGKPDSH